MSHTLTTPTTGPVHGHAAPGDRIRDTQDRNPHPTTYRVVSTPQHSQDHYLLLDTRTLRTRLARTLTSSRWQFTA